MMMFVSTLLASSASSSGASSDASSSDLWSLRLIPSHPDAKCLDGSRPGYYIRPGVGNDAHNFKLHFMGGNWCRDAESCSARSRTVLGSSNFWPASSSDLKMNDSTGIWDMGSNGLMSAVAGPLRNWTAVWIMYCDGSSFSSFRALPLEVNGSHVYMRGRLILDAVLDDLIERQGFSTASTVLLSGTSSGGMAVYYHSEHVRARLPPEVRVLAAPDAGFFPDAPLPAGHDAFRLAIKGLISFFNISDDAAGVEYPGASRKCLAANAARNAMWRCLFAEYTIPSATTVPFFVPPAAFGTQFPLNRRRT